MRKQTGFRNRGWLPAIGNRLSVAAGVALTAGLLAGSAQGATRTTIATGYWTNEAVVWGVGSLPQVGDDVVVAHAVTLDESTPWLASCSNSATLTFRGTNTALKATHISVNGTITHNAQTDITGTCGVYADWTPDNRVWIACSNLTVAAGKSIDVKGKGYLGGSGPGGSPNGFSAGGGGYGGSGGVGNDGVRGTTYGSATAPADPGSGGGKGFQGSAGGAGGGMVCIEATGAITVRGEINANGNNGAEGRDGGGSGGSIRIACRTLDGEGWLRAVGGLAAGGFTGVGSGGGGRIAVDVNAAEQALVSGTVPQITTARGENHQVGTPGTIYTSDPDKLLPETLDGMVAAEYYTGTTAEWTPGSLTVKNRAISFQTPGITINSPGNVTLLSSLSLTNYTTLKCANLLLTNSAYLRVYAGVTNGSWPNYAARVCVNGAIDVHSNCTIYADSATYRQHSPPDGGPVRFETQHLTIHAWGAFNADGLGYSGATNYNVTGDRGFGLGGGASAYRGYGGGYGGTGNGAGGGYGGTYGTANAPAAVGSGGGNGYQANDVPNSRSGGGCIWIRATGNLTVNGAISASAGVPGGQGGGGSGGGVFIVCKTVQGTAGINAGGGNSGGGYGGGGGRIAVWYNTTPAQLDAYLLNGAGAITTDPPPNYGLDKLSVTGGTGYNSGNGQSGTKSFYSIPPPKGTVIMMR